MKKVLFLCSLIILGVLTGCGGKTKSNDKSSAEKQDANSNLILPEVENKSGKVMIQTVTEGSNGFPYNSYIISSSKGENVVVDPFQMPMIDVVDVKPTVIMSTHDHPDHVDSTFTDSYGNEVKKFCRTVEAFKTKDFNIYSVASAHDGDDIMENPTNVIIVMEVDGLRIAHFGDAGQTKFSQEQLDKIGKIDIAFMQFENSFSHMDLKNLKGFNLLAQVNPTIVIPTHYTDKALPIFEQKIGKIEDFTNKMTVSKADLTPGKTRICRILNTHTYC